MALNEVTFKKKHTDAWLYDVNNKNSTHPQNNNKQTNKNTMVGGGEVEGAAVRDAGNSELG